MFQMLAVPLAMAAGGYMLDKYAMGGDGTKGAIMGGAAGAGKGPAGAAAGGGTGAVNTMPLVLDGPSAAGAITPSFFDGLSLAKGGYDASAGLNSLNSGSNLMSAGNNIASASNAFTLPSEVSNVLDIGKEYAGKAYDYVDEGLEGMSFSDKLNAGALGYQALGQQDPTMQRVTNGEMLQSQYQNPRDGLLDISVAGPTGSEMTRNELTPEQLAMLGLL